MLKNTMIYTIGNMLPKLIVFFMLPIYMNYLTPEEYGLIQTINALVAVLSILYLTSLRTSVTRSYIDYDSDDDKQGFILSVSLFLIIFSVFLSVILLSLKGFITPILFNNIPADPYFLYMILLSFLSVFPTIPLTLLRIKEQAITYVTFNTIETVLIVTFTVYLLIVRDMGAIGSLQAIIYARFIMAILYLVYILYFTRLKFRECKMIYVTSSLALSIPLIPHFLAGWMNSVGDRVVIEQFLNLSELGIYSLGAQFNMGLMLLVTSFNMAYTPRLFNMMKEEKVTQNFYSKLFNGVVLTLLVVSLLGLISLPLFIQYLGSDEYQSSYLFVWLLFGGTLWHLGYIMSVSSLVYYKKMKKVAVITVITAVVNIGLNLIFIPILGIFGAAVATYISYFFQFYYVKGIGNRYTKSYFQIQAKALYIAQLLLIGNLVIVWLIDSYYILIGTIIAVTAFMLYTYKNQLMPSRL